MVVYLAKAAGFSGALPLRNGAMFAADHCAMTDPRTAAQTRATVALVTAQPAAPESSFRA